MTDSEIYTKSEKMAQGYIERDAAIQHHLENEQHKSTAKIKAELTIYEHISKWVKQTIEVGQQIPNIRERSFGDRQPSAFSVDEYIRAVLEASDIYKTPELKKRLKALENIKATAEKMREEIASLDPGMMVAAKIAARNLQPNLEGRIVGALGADKAAYMGLEVIALGVIEQIVELKFEIKMRPHLTAGRARNEAAHRVALEAARLYAKVTGKKPTYCENENGLSGQYTPFLHDIYNAFDWNPRSLRLPAETAINGLGNKDYKLELIPLYSPITTYS